MREEALRLEADSFKELSVVWTVQCRIDAKLALIVYYCATVLASVIWCLAERSIATERTETGRKVAVRPRHQSAPVAMVSRTSRVCGS
jgi:hypothetical protein